jgi:hypothetical protein
MLRPTLDEVLGNVIESFETWLVPEITEPYALSVAQTVGNLLRHVRARAGFEPEALWHDNADLRQVLDGLGVAAPPPLADQCYPGLEVLVNEAMELREALDAFVVEHPGHPDVLAYLARQLQRQRPWMVEAWSGPRR